MGGGGKQMKKNIDSLWPQDGDVFYWVRSDIGAVCESIWIKESQSCKFRASIGNVFRSREDATQAIEAIKKLAEKKGWGN